MINNIWPLPTSTFLEKFSKFISKKNYDTFGYCNICKKFTLFHLQNGNLRETLFCHKCGSSSRKRQLAYVFTILEGKRERNYEQTKIWITESNSILVKMLKNNMKNDVIASEYFDENLKSGDVFHDIIHIDMTKTHFEDCSLDYIISSDVLEHIPNFNVALNESYRILKYGGYHIFTVPFYNHRSSIEFRTILEDNKLIHKKNKWFHLDPNREEGILCYTVFSIEILCILERLGFNASLVNISKPFYGIFPPQYAIIAKKVNNAVINEDLF